MMLTRNNNNTNNTNDAHDAFTWKRVSKYILVEVGNKKFTSEVIPAR